MAWKVHKEHPKHFEVHGTSGPFRISKANLSASQLNRMRMSCGGKVQKMADGGELEQPPPTSDPVGEWVVGKGEGLLTGVTSTAAAPASWAAGLHDLIGQGLNKLKPVEPVGGHQPNPGDTVERVQNALTYEPRTEAGKRELEESANNPIVKAIGRWNQRGADKLTGSGVPPWVAGAILGTVGGMDIPGIGGEGAAAEPRPGSLLKLSRPTRGAALPWPKYSEAQAGEAARKGFHLTEKNGQYVGGPPGVGSQELPKLRQHFDLLATIGKQMGADKWYDESAKTIGEVTGSPEDAHRMASVAAAYSPNKSVQQALNQTTGHLTREALFGNEEARAAMPGNKREANKASAILRDEPVHMGPKEGPFAQYTDPTRTGEPRVQTVNDTHIGQIWGYPGGMGFKDSQHSWMNGEHHLALDRLKKAGVLGPEATPEQVQASAWAGKLFMDNVGKNGGRLQALAPEERAAAIEQIKQQSLKTYRQLLPQLQANATYETMPGVQGHLRDWQSLNPKEQQELSQSHAWASPGEPDPIYAALKIPQLGTTEGLGEYRHTENRPILEPAMRDPETGRIYHQPGASTHTQAEMMVEGDPDETVSARYHDTYGQSGLRGGDWAGYINNATGNFLTRTEAADFAKDLWHQNSGWTDIRTGEPALISEEISNRMPNVDAPIVERNPNFAAHPLLSFEGTGGPDAPSRELLKQAETFRGYVDAQKQGAWNMPRAKHGTNAALMRFPESLTDPQARELYDLANKHGLNYVSGDRASGTMTGDFGGMPGGEFGRRLEKVLRFRDPASPAAQVERGGYHGDLTPEIPWGDIKHQESGTATAHMLNTVSPRVGESLDMNSEIKSAIENKIRASEKAPEKYGFRTWGPQESVQRARQMLLDYGVEGMRHQVTEAGEQVAREAAANPNAPQQSFSNHALLIAGAKKLGLPAFLAGYLATRETDDQPQQKWSGGKVQHMADGGEMFDPNFEPSTGAPVTPMSDDQRRSLVESAPLGMLRGMGIEQSAQTPPPEAMVATQPQAQAPAAPAAQPMQAPSQMPQQPPMPASGISTREQVMGAAADTQQAMTRKSDLEEWASNALANEQQRRASTERQAAVSLQQMQGTNRARLDKMFNDLMDPRNNIDPEHFWAEKGTWGKVKAGIGMIIAGMGAGLTGQPNLAAQFLQRSIDRDIEAQKANLGKKWTQLGFFRDMMHDDIAAEQMTRAYLINATSSEIAAQATRSQGIVNAQQGRVFAAQARQSAMQMSDEATMRGVQTSLSRIQLQQAARNEFLIGHIYGTGGSASQDVIREAGARGLIKPVVVDRQGTLAMARSDGDATKLNDELPHWHTAQDILQQMQDLRMKSKASVANPLSDNGKLYRGLQVQLAGALDHATNGRVNADTLQSYVSSMGGGIGQLWYADPLAATREWVNSQHRELVNAHTWHREEPSVSGKEVAPAVGPGAFGPPPTPGAVHITDGARGGWLLPGKPLPQGWRKN